MYPSVPGRRASHQAESGGVMASYQQQLFAEDAAGYGLSPDEDEVLLREPHPTLRMGTGRLQRSSTHASNTPTSSKHGAPGSLHMPSLAATAAATAAGAGRKGRRRWAEDEQDDSHAGGTDSEFISVGRQQQQQQQQTDMMAVPANTGHIVRMRRGEAWGKFLAYEGCCQVCMREGAKAVPEASFFLSSGCEPLRSGLGINGLLLPQVLAAHMVNAIGSGSPAIDLGNEVIWDDFDADDRKLSAAAFMNHMSVMKVRVSRLELPQAGLGVLSRLVCRNADYSRITVHLKLVPHECRPVAEVPYRLRKDGGCLPGSPVFDLQPEHCNNEVVLDVMQGSSVLARGKISCRRLWQIGLEHGPGDGDGDGYYGGGDGYGNGASDMGGVAGLQQKGICTWLSKGSGELARGGGNGGSTGLWVNVFDSGSPQPGRVMLTMSRTQRELPPGAGDLGGGVGRGAGGDDAGGQSKATLKVSSCQAYDYILLAALRSQGCGESRLEVTGEWAWMLQAFAGQYGVRSNYATMTHLRWVLRPGVASVSQACFDLLAHKLRPLLEQEAAGGCTLTQHEATMLDQIKGDTEELLKLAFENYYLLSSAARKGILDGACSPTPGHAEFPPTALVAGVHLFECMRDVFHPSDVEWLGDRFRLAAKGRWARLAMLVDEGQQQDASPLRQHHPSARSPQAARSRDAAAASADRAAAVYTKMIRTAAAIQQDLEYDRRLQEVPRMLPTSLNLPAITAAEYCVNYVQQLRAVLAQHPPNQPTEGAIDMLVAVAQLQRYLEEHGLAVQRGQPGCIDALELFGPHVRSWITNSQEALCASCRSLEATTELSSMAAAGTAAAPPLGSAEEGGVAPICHEMLRAIVGEMQRYERVISHWPLFGPYLEAALCVVLRSIVAAVSRQCGMTRVRGGPAADAFGRSIGAAASSASMPGKASGGAYSRPASRPGSSMAQRFGERFGGHHSPLPARSTPQQLQSAAAQQQFSGMNSPTGVGSLAAQWAWTNLEAASPPRGGGRGAGSAPRVLLMVREAVLLNSLKRLMVAAPIYEATLNKWTGSAAGHPGAASAAAADAARLGSSQDDVASVIGAQFAQVVKELRTEYSSGVASTCQRMTGALSSNASTSIFSLLNQAKASSAQAGNSMTSMQQAAMIESLASGLFACLNEVLGNLAAALDSRVFVAMGRGLWDFIGRDLLKFVENLQEGKDNKNAWRTRQNATLLLDQINHFFRAGLVQAMEHVLQERDLAVPLHIAAIQKLLAGNTTALNMNFTPF